jgi:ankyrin repeat protein
MLRPTQRINGVERRCQGRHGREAIVKLLPAEEVDMDSKDKDWTPLSWAIENGHKEIVQLLLAEGVDTDSKDKDGQTPRMGTRRLVNVIHQLSISPCD